tara:strand:- start:328 stop:588 length:261 start_codon:yes stop_codon:yes gene_type:complete
MDINKLIKILKKKLGEKISLQSIEIQDKSFLHKKHKSNQKGKYHLKLIIKSDVLRNMNRIESNKKIYNIINEELKKYIHSIQILIR